MEKHMRLRDPVLSRPGFVQLAKEVALEINPDIALTRRALNTLRDSAEDHIIFMFQGMPQLRPRLRKCG